MTDLLPCWPQFIDEFETEASKNQLISWPGKARGH